MTVALTKDVTLPAKLKKAWRGSKVLVFSSRDSYIVKRIRTSTAAFRKAMLEAGKGISKKDLAAAIKEARQ